MAPGLSPITVAAESRYMNLRESTFPLSILIDRIILAKKNKLRPESTTSPRPHHVIDLSSPEFFARLGFGSRAYKTPAEHTIP
jgi:hypothetical protein